MTPEDARAGMIDILDATEDALGTEQWRAGYGPEAQPCRRDGDGGMIFLHTRIGPGSENAQANIDAVRSLWDDNGMSTRVVHSTNPSNTTIRLYGSGGPLKSIGYAVDEERSSLMAESLCVEGNFDDY